MAEYSKAVLREMYKMVMQAIHPEDIFGDCEDPEEQTGLVEENYLELCGILNPEEFSGDSRSQGLATEGRDRLDELYQAAQEKLNRGEYGGIPLSGRRGYKRWEISTRKRTYRLSRKIADGELSVVHGGRCIDGERYKGKPVVIKIYDDSSLNRLAINEAKVLKIFQANPAPQTQHLPHYIEQFNTGQDERLANVMGRLDGYTLLDICQLCYPDGIPPVHAAWMLERMLSAIGYAHKLGIIHGNLEPAHVIIWPQTHNVYLADWSYAVIKPKVTHDRFKAYNPEYSAPEVERKETPLSSADMYSIGKIMIYLLGGDVAKKTIPRSVDERFRRFIQTFVMESPLQRERDAWRAFNQWQKIRSRIWTTPKFRKFIVNL